MTLNRGQEIHNNRYRIVAPLGAGGMGAVYRAWDKSLNIPVALKENLDASQDAQELFVQEAQILARLSHPSLTRVTDYFVIPGMGQYLVMDFIEGKDLKELAGLDTPSPHAIPEDQALAWMAQVCEAMEYLHNQNPPIIHRDIKPDNIKITPNGRAVLVDFGIAKIFDASRQTSSAARRGTPGYAPPEQYGMARTDARSDIYALGATLYAVLTGVEPPDSVDRLSRNAAMKPPRKLNPGISPRVEKAILKCMILEAARRYQTASELKNALRVKPSAPRPATTGLPLPIAGAAAAPIVKPATGVYPAVQPGGAVSPTSTTPKPAKTRWRFSGRATLAIILLLSVIVCIGGILLSSPDLLETFRLPTSMSTDFAELMPGQPTNTPRPTAKVDRTIRPPVIKPGGSGPLVTSGATVTRPKQGTSGSSNNPPTPTLALVTFTVRNNSNKETWISIDRLAPSGGTVPVLRTSSLAVGGSKTISGYYGPSTFRLTWTCGGGIIRHKDFKISNSLAVKINNQCNVTQ